MKSFIEKIIRECNALPTLPSVIADMARLLDDDNTGAADFEKVVRPDPALTANLLKLANSAYFGARRQIVSVRQAIVFLGTDRIFELAATAWLMGTIALPP